MGVIQGARIEELVRLLWDRHCHEERRPLYGELLSEVAAGCGSLRGLVNDPSVGPALRNWAADAYRQGLNYQFQRYRRYLLEGTIRPLAGRPG